MSCQLSDAERAIGVLRSLSCHPVVLDASHLPPEAAPREAHMIDIVLDSDSVPPALLRTLATNDCSLVESQPRSATGSHWLLVSI